MQRIEEALFLLLRLGLETSSTDEEALQDLRVLKKEDWLVLKQMADKQSVSAIAFDGLNRICQKYGKEVSDGIEQMWWKKFILEWTALMMKIEQKNHQQIDVMKRMSEIWAKEGCRVMVMKGQANAVLYPHLEHRNPGDIDCYLFEDYARGNDIARKVGAKVDEGWYKHSQIHYQREMFENHQFFVHTREGKRSKKLEILLEKELQVADYRYFQDTAILLPPTMFNALFLTYHAMSHFLEEGIRLKQILDWAMFLKQEQDHVDWLRFYELCKDFHMLRFANAMTDISVNLLGIKITNHLLVAESPYTERIVQSALHDDDYVFSTGTGWQNRWHIIQNLFRYRWKYHKIYQESILKQLWYYATGYLFKTE